MADVFAHVVKRKVPTLMITDIGTSQIAQSIVKKKAVLISLILLLVFIFVAVMAPFIVPYDPAAIDLKNKNLAPSHDHVLGTDYLGRDMLSRILVGATTSLSIAASVVIVSLIIGITMGCIAGYYGGIVDETISRIIDIFLSFPGMIFALTIMGVLGSGVVNLIIALALVQWSTYARLMRGQVLSLRKNEYVLSAMTIGASDLHIMRKHIIPNSISPIIVLATIDLGFVILSIAALSFLGIGLPADIPEWGAMLSSGKEFMRTAPYQTIFPGIAITFVVVIFSILSDGIRDILDPHEIGGEVF
jgi:peptide/nickel transport system permease protein